MLPAPIHSAKNQKSSWQQSGNPCYRPERNVPTEKMSPLRISTQTSVEEFPRGESSDIELTRNFRSENCTKFGWNCKLQANFWREGLNPPSLFTSSPTMAWHGNSSLWELLALWSWTLCYAFEAHHSYKQTKWDAWSNWSYTSFWVWEPPPYHECKEVGKSVYESLVPRWVLLCFLLLCMACCIY